jgi:Saccharopine dehydrogenase NADP binding domain
MSSEPAIAIYGASGMAGAAIARALDSAPGATGSLRLVGRDGARLEAAAVPGAAVHVAAAEDRAALIAAFTGCRVVVNAAGPFAQLGDPIVASAIAAGCHYLDLCAEQAVVRHVFERHDAPARHGQVAVVPGAAFSAIGDLLAASATARLLDVKDEGPTVRQVALRRLASPEPIELAIGYLFDELSLSPGAQASVFANLHAKVSAWRRDRWDEERPGRHQRTFNDGAGSREAFSVGGADNLTVPRHVAAHTVDTFLAVGRSAGVHRALRLAALAASWLPAGAAAYLVTSPADAAAYAATRFTVVATATHPFDVRHARAHGRDLYATSTAITTRLALGLAHRPTGPFGVLAASEIVRAPAFLDELAAASVLTVD